MGATEDLGAGSTFNVDNIVARVSISAPGVSTAAAKVTAATPADPATTTSTSSVMAGTGFSFTPASSSALVTISGMLGITAGSATAVTVSGRYGSGTTPANGAAASSSGSAFPQTAFVARASTNQSTGTIPFAIQSKLTGLTPGQPYWVDPTYKTGVAASPAVISNLCLTALECQ